MSEPARSVVPIAACATPWGHGAISVVRVSGGDLARILRDVCGCVPTARGLGRVTLRDADGPFDTGVLAFFPGPRSYTGEDVAEISCHGNPLLVERLLGAVCAAGARVATPGEFTRRAFLNGKLDLPRAEAVLQAIRATSPAGLALARNGLEGAVSARAEALRDRLTDLAAELEAILDYPGEDLLFAPDDAIAGALRAVADEAGGVAGTWRAGRVAIEGARVALIGETNAGKSSLFNALLGRPRAIVSPTPGTTRDVVESALQLETVRITLLDTAGERDAADPIEAEGVALARALADDVDLLLVVIPLDRPVSDASRAVLERTADRARLVVGSHADRAVVPMDIAVSSVSGAGIEALKARIVEALRGEEAGGAGIVLGTQRQRDLFAEVARCAAEAADTLGSGGPAVAAERVYAALAALDGIIGRDTREAVLDRLFARFCIGK